MTVTQSMCVWGPVRLQRERSGTGGRGGPQGAFRSCSRSGEAFKRSRPPAGEGETVEKPPRPNGFGRSGSERAAPVPSPAVTSSVRSTVTAAPPAAAPSAPSSAALHGAVRGLVLAVAAEPAVPVAVVAASSAAAVRAAAVAAVAAVAVVAAAALGQPVVVPVTGAAAAPTPSSSPAAPRGPRGAAPARLDVLLGHGLLHLHAVALDRVELHHGRFVGRVVVLEVDEAEAALLAALLVGDDLGLLHRAELAEVLHQVPFAHVPFQAAHEQLLHFRVGAGFGRVLAGHGALQLHRVPVHGVRRGGHGGVRLLHRRVRDEAEAAGALGLRVEHHHAVGQRAVGREVLPQPGLRGLHVEAADEQLAELRVLHAGAAPGPGAETPPPVGGQRRILVPPLFRSAASFLPSLAANGAASRPPVAPEARPEALISPRLPGTRRGASRPPRRGERGWGKTRTRTKWRRLLLGSSAGYWCPHKGGAGSPAPRARPPRPRDQ